MTGKLEVVTVISRLRDIAPISVGQTYVFTTTVSTRAGHIHPRGSWLIPVAPTSECPHGEIDESGTNWVCHTQYGESVWATLGQCVSRGLLRLILPAKELS